jgi:predicted HTH domain antitoxin
MLLRSTETTMNCKGVYTMRTLTLNIPEEVFLDLHEDSQTFNEYVNRVVALDLYKNKKVSLGYCSQVANMPKEDFIYYLGQNGVSIFSVEDEKEFLEELDNA